MASIDDLLENFFQNESNVFTDYVEVIDDPGELVTTIVFLTDKMEKIENFSDLSILEHYYLTYLPKEAAVFPDEVLAIHEVLLDFYQHLYEKGYLTIKNYKDALLFFQKNKHTFIEKMCNEQFWSKGKQQQLNEIDEKVMDSMPTELEQLFKNLGEAQQKPKTKDNNKIINFPTGQPQKKNPYALQLRIDLKGFKPPIWRRVLVSSDSTLADLHDIIQNCFEWENEHLYLFNVDGNLIEPTENKVDSLWNSMDDSKLMDTTLIEIFPKNKTIDYVYDFGDDWQHKITFEAEIASSELPSISKNGETITSNQLPICLTGRQGAPLENSKGDEEFASFDIDKINARLKNL